MFLGGGCHFSPSGEVKFVMPAHAGIQVLFDYVRKTAWTPASAEMTDEKSTSSR
jgi:hypothetical protein